MIDLGTRASQLDPLNARVLTILGDTLGALRRYEDEEQILARQIALTPNDPDLRVAPGYTIFKRTGSTAKLREAVNFSDPAHESDSSAFARWGERKFDDAISNIQESPFRKVETEFGIFPKELLIALSYWAKGDRDAAQPYFEQSRIFMEPVVEKKTEGPRLRVALGLAYAGLGRKAEALQQGQLAKDGRPTTVDPVGGPPVAVTFGTTLRHGRGKGRCCSRAHRVS